MMRRGRQHVVGLKEDDAHGGEAGVERVRGRLRIHDVLLILNHCLGQNFMSLRHEKHNISLTTGPNPTNQASNESPN
jgi:hypothetical protein